MRSLLEIECGVHRPSQGLLLLGHQVADLLPQRRLRDREDVVAADHAVGTLPASQGWPPGATSKDLPQKVLGASLGGQQRLDAIAGVQKR